MNKYAFLTEPAPKDTEIAEGYGRLAAANAKHCEPRESHGVNRYRHEGEEYMLSFNRVCSAFRKQDASLTDREGESVRALIENQNISPALHLNRSASDPLICCTIKLQKLHPLNALISVPAFHTFFRRRIRPDGSSVIQPGSTRRQLFLEVFAKNDWNCGTISVALQCGH
jgi:hypothetical protein